MPTSSSSEREREKTQTDFHSCFLLFFPVSEGLGLAGVTAVFREGESSLVVLLDVACLCVHMALEVGWRSILGWCGRRVVRGLCG